MKNISLLLLCLLVFSFQSCKKCKKENPRARVVNNGLQDVSVQIKTSGGNTENINNVAVGTSSEYKTYAPGIVTFTIVVNKLNYVKEIPMEQCYEYSIIIDGNNNIVSTPTDRNK